MSNSMMEGDPTKHHSSNDAPPPSQEDATSTTKGEEGTRKETATVAATPSEKTSSYSTGESTITKGLGPRVVNSSSTLQQEKANIVYPKFRQKHLKEANTSTANLGVGSHAVGGTRTGGILPVLRGIMKNQGRIDSSIGTNSNDNAHPLHRLRGLWKNQGRSRVGSNQIARRIRGLGKNRGRNFSRYDSNSDLEEQEPSYHIPPTVQDNRVDLPPANTFCGRSNNNINGLDMISDDVESHGEQNNSAQTGIQPSRYDLPSELGNREEQQQPTNPVSDGLVEAIPVEEDPLSLGLKEAQPVNQEDLDQRAERGINDKKCIRCSSVVVAVACLVMIVSLAVGLGNIKESSMPHNKDVSNPPRPIPNIKNLEILYDEIPEKTKESLYNSETPQREAWEWLLKHPNITTYPEWRKKQIFAMVTFFYSFQGPQWRDRYKKRWLNVSISECSWVMTDTEVAFLTWQFADILGSVYGFQDYQACDEDGRLQMLGSNGFKLTMASTIPVLPPEISLLTSLRVLGILYSHIDTKLSDLLIPELIQLPNLRSLVFRGTSEGTFPKDFGLMTNLRHLSIGESKLVGTIPPDIGKMTSLEFFGLDRIEVTNANLPSELGLLTSLTGLWIVMTSFAGRIPSQLGLLTSTRDLSIWKNKYLMGSIPSDLGMMSSLQTIYLGDNALTGSVPSQLGLMTSLTGLWLGNYFRDEGCCTSLSGSLPRELWELPQLKELYLSNLPDVFGIIPRETMTNLSLLRVEGSPHLSGKIPEEICHLQEESSPSKMTTGHALDFDCSDLFCGCTCECKY